MNAPVYLGIDVGTQSVRVMAVTDAGMVAAAASEPLTSVRDGVRHEQEPEHWWRAVAQACRVVTAALGPAEIKSLAVDATSGTILLVDGQVRPTTPGLMYDDGRAGMQAQACNRAGGSLWRSLSYRMQPSWALPKLLWLARNAMVEADSRLLHQNDFIHARLAGRLLPADASNSLKTGYDLIHGRWPSDIHEELGLRPELFPMVVAPGVRIGEVSASASGETRLPAGTPIISGMTDGCAAQIASGATRPGSWNVVVGTTLVIKGVTTELLHDPLGAVYSHRSADGFWLPGGASSVGAGAVARDFAGEDLEQLNRQAIEHGPTPTVAYPLVGRGERYPFAAPEAAGFLLGEAQSKTERFCATLQGIAFMERLCFSALRQIGAETDGPFTISGGAARSEALSQMRADVLERELGMPCATEAAFGMAMLAASADSGLSAVTERMARTDRVITPGCGFAPYADAYAALVRELAARGWLGAPLAAFALEEAQA